MTALVIVTASVDAEGGGREPAVTVLGALPIILNPKAEPNDESATCDVALDDDGPGAMIGVGFCSGGDAGPAVAAVLEGLDRWLPIRFLQPNKLEIRLLPLLLARWCMRMIGVSMGELGAEFGAEAGVVRSGAREATIAAPAADGGPVPLVEWGGSC